MIIQSSNISISVSTFLSPRTLTLKMEAARSSETLVWKSHTTQCNNHYPPPKKNTNSNSLLFYKQVGPSLACMITDKFTLFMTSYPCICPS